MTRKKDHDKNQRALDLLFTPPPPPIAVKRPQKYPKGGHFTKHLIASHWGSRVMFSRKACHLLDDGKRRRESSPSEVVLQLSHARLNDPLPAAG